MIRAKVFLPLVEPYTEEDFASMDSFEAERNKAFGLKKIVGEKEIDAISAKNQEQFRHKVASLCDKNKPLPIFVKLLNDNTLGRTFITPRRYRDESRNPIVEEVDYIFNEKGRAIIKFVEFTQKKYSKVVERFLVAKTGTGNPWKLAYSEKQRRELLKVLEDFGRPLQEKMYAELADRFGFDKKRIMTGFQNNGGYTYRTMAELRRERLVHDFTAALNTILQDCIEERGRFIAKGGFAGLWIYRYREQIHPELLAPDEIGTSGMSFGGGIPWGRVSSRQIMHAENSSLCLCSQPRGKKRRRNRPKAQMH